MSAISNIYLRNRIFDIYFVMFIPLLALVSVALVVLDPSLFEPILALDLMFLGYHHVISTYTRLMSSGVTPRQHKFLVIYLPPFVLLLVVALAMIGSIWLVTTVYLHWQWWHYTRQSDGIAKSIRIKSASVEAGGERFSRFVFYSIPIACFIFMSSRQPEEFLFMPVKVLPIPSLLGIVFLAAAIILFSVWLIFQIWALRKGHIKINYLLYVLSHHLIYFVAYVFVENITVGWLAINIWHNLQYISFVWHFNANTFKAGIDKQNFIVSWLSQPARAFIYVGACLIATFIFYSGVNLAAGVIVPYTALPVLIIAYQAINFHHYVVDSMIWKIRTKNVKQSIGIDA